MIKGLQR